MSEYDSLIEGYPGLDDPANDPGPLSDEENQALEEMMAAEPARNDSEQSEPPSELRALRPDQRPESGQHYVIYNGKPMPVMRDITATEDEFVRSQLDLSDTLKDHDGQRQVRADRTLRMRYRGYVCGEMSSL